LEKRDLRRRCSRTKPLEILQRSEGGQDKRKADNKSTGLTGSRGSLTGTTGLTGTKTGLTGECRESGSFSKNKTRSSFKELLAKYEKQEVIQKKEKRSDEAKDVSLSLKLQEQ